MSRALQVKVCVSKVITALDKKLIDNAVIVEHNEKVEKEYPAIMSKWHNALLKEFKDSLVIEDVTYRGYSNTLLIEYKMSNDAKLPTRPDKDCKRALSSYEVEEIENALAILNMTDDEFVNASTMKSISQYL